MIKVRNLREMDAVVEHLEPIQVSGYVTRVAGTVIEGDLPDCAVGQICHVYPGPDRSPVLAEIVGFQGRRVVMMPLGDMQGMRPGSAIRVLNSAPTIPVGDELLGRVFDGLGRPLDGRPAPACPYAAPIYRDTINPFRRRRITEPLDVGVRSINALATVCTGQRMAIMAGSGVGKSVLLGMMARYTNADVNVIGLIGERGRELRDFLERDLGPEGLARSVVVTATSEEPALVRVRAAFIATAIAEYFRDCGKRVLLMMDSVTRFAMAQREVGLAAGEPPTSKGYTPSVFALLPRLLERVGMGPDGSEGSITGLYTVLVEGDDLTEPISDSVRSILDGHIVLSRKLADSGHYPAVDVLGSVSRLMADVVSREHYQAAMKINGLIAAYRRAETLINIGAYARGSNPEVDTAIQLRDAINQFLRQDVSEPSSYEDSVKGLQAIASREVRQEAPLPPAQAPGRRQAGADARQGS